MWPLEVMILEVFVIHVFLEGFLINYFQNLTWLSLFLIAILKYLVNFFEKKARFSGGTVLLRTTLVRALNTTPKVCEMKIMQTNPSDDKNILNKKVSEGFLSAPMALAFLVRVGVTKNSQLTNRFS